MKRQENRDIKSRNPRKTLPLMSNAKSSGSAAVTPTAKVFLLSTVKAEPEPSPVVPTQVPKPPPDRMTALRRAKAAMLLPGNSNGILCCRPFLELFPALQAPSLSLVCQIPRCSLLHPSLSLFFLPKPGHPI
ncbi:hypothetical protein BYT27DRAFT_7188289 [Phlegmacium glaucopus]|nr:hypothetical protein BYT27DRAFT_7188289 [Phlegmacium glaucopus]